MTKAQQKKQEVAERKKQREQKKLELEQKRKEREKKKQEREEKRIAKENAAAEKANDKLKSDKMQTFIDTLNINTECFAAVPMNRKEKDIVKKILGYEYFKSNITAQTMGKVYFKVLATKDNEYVLSVDDIYYLYDKDLDDGINFGPTSQTWLDSVKKIPWNFKKVNLNKRGK